MKTAHRTTARAISVIERLEPRQLLSAGGLDTTFGTGGKTTLSFGPLTADTSAITVQADGKVVMVGRASDGDLALARLNANGTPDTTFGPTHNGEVVTGYAGSSEVFGQAVAVQSDGKIVVGATRGFSTFDILRFNPDGSFDKTFDGDGVVNVDVGFDNFGSPNSLALQQDGKIVAVGDQHSGGFFIARLNSNGSLDQGFGDSGTESIDLGADVDLSTAVAIDCTGTAASNADFGHIVVAGEHFDDSNSHQDIDIARLNTNGSLDHSFNGGGTRVIGISGKNFLQCDSVLIEGSGRIVLGGSEATDSSTARHLMLMSIMPNGQSDNSFGIAGNGVVTNLSAGIATSVINGFAQHIIASANIGGSFVMAAYSLDGKLDNAFGNGGVVALPNFSAQLVAPGPNRTIIAAGGIFQAARLFDIGPNISVTAINTTAAEKGSQAVTFFVTRDVRLDFATRVYFTIGGTANSPTFFAVTHHTNDYTLSGMTIPQFVIIGGNSHPFVDVPAGQTFTQVTLTPVDDKNIEGLEYASFTINTDALYDVGSPNSATINIKDDVNTLKVKADAHVNDGGNANTNFGAAAVASDRRHCQPSRPR
jgi:uncharacterized delta-60 repeat protein